MKKKLIRFLQIIFFNPGTYVTVTILFAMFALGGKIGYDKAIAEYDKKYSDENLIQLYDNLKHQHALIYTKCMELENELTEKIKKLEKYEKDYNRNRRR